VNRRGLLVLACSAAAWAQTAPAPVTPAISAYFRLGGQTAGPYPYRWLVVDPPLTLTVDAAGVPHLGIVPTNCSMDANYNVTCGNGPAAVFAIPALIQVTGEIPQPVAGAAIAQWTVANVPIQNGIFCTRNGLVQKSGLDYSIAGATITSASWQAGVDTLLCNYQYAHYPTPPVITQSTPAAAPAALPAVAKP
jgi:hypothetical protein